MREKVEEMTTVKAAANKGQRGRRSPRPDPVSGPRPLPRQPEARRSLRPRRGRLLVFDGYESSEEEEGRGRGRRKVKLVLKLPHSPDSPVKPQFRKPAPDDTVPARVPPSAAAASSSASASSASYAGEDAVKPLKKRRINGCDDGVGSDGSGRQEERKKNGVRRSKGSAAGTSPDSPKGTPLPERTTLESILEKLQKKDTYSVYAEPVDPEELPDYHEVIEHPMDFGTIRKKLVRNAYRTFEQFEDDVFLICSNAMQYNAPHTIYFKQARTIEEMARKNFQILRADANCIETERKSEEEIKFSSMEKKPLKKSLYRAEQEPLGSDLSSSATLASARDTCAGLSTAQANAFEKPATDNGLNLTRANGVEKPATSNGLSTTRANAFEKPATANGLNSTRVNAVEKPATANGLRKTRANAFEKPATSNGLSMARANAVEKPATANGLNKARSNAVQNPATSNGLSMERANAVEKPATANALSTTRANAVEKSATANGLRTTQANTVEKPATANGLSTTQTNAVEKPATANGLCMAQVNEFEKPTTANGLSMVQAIAVEKPATNKGFADCNSSLGESKSEKADEFSAKSSPSKIGRKSLLVYENRRATYNKSDQPLVVESDSMFDVFERETKHLVAVESHSDYSYPRSLARFAAFLGPIGWDIASKRIEKALPAGIKFGPGWVGEYEPLPTPVLSLENHTQQQLRNGSNLQCMVGSRTGKETEGRSKATQNGVSNDKLLGLKSQLITGMPQRATNPAEGAIFGGQKQGLFGVSAETQPRVANAMLQQQKDQVAVDSARADNNVPAQVGLCNLSSVSSIPVEKALRRPKFHSEAHKQKFGASSETQPRITKAELYQQNDQVAIDFTKDCNNASELVGVGNSTSVSSIPVETALQRTKYRFRAQKIQPRITNATLHEQKDQVAIDFKACNNISEQVGMRNSSFVSSIPVEKASQRHEYHSQAQKQGWLGVSAEIQPRITNVMLQHQKDQVAIDFAKAYYNVPDQVRAHNSSPESSIPVETDLQGTECRSEVATSGPLGMISRNRDQVQPEPQKQLETMNSQSGKDALGLTVGGLRNGKVVGSSDSNRAITSLEFVSSQQSGVADYCVSSGSREQAIDFRIMGLSGKISNHPNYLNTGIYTVKQVMSPVPPPRRDDPNSAAVPAAASRAWMSFGGSAECRLVDGMGLTHTQIGSASFHDSAWKTPNSAARIDGDSMVRPLSQVFPQTTPLVTEESQVQNRGLVFFPQPVATDLSRFHGRSPWQGLVPHAQPGQKDMRPPDLNIGFQPLGSPVRPSSGILVDSQQPDLALQL